MPDLPHLVVADREDLTADAAVFDLREPSGLPLPGFTTGSHITVTTPAGPRRSYSLIDAGTERPDRYRICVRRDDTGRGGSRSMHEDLHPGDTVPVSGPVNTFPLQPAERYVLIAGGIGITAIRAMVAELRARGGARLDVVYLTRTPEGTAFFDEFHDDGSVLHHSDARGRYDLWPHLQHPDDSTRIYCCGPTALLEEVRALTMHWRPTRIHVEDFAGVDALGGSRAPFTAIWEPTQARIDVPADRSLLDALERAGVEVDSSCRSGTCGTCRLRLVGGRAEHRDLVLTEQERQEHVMPCVSRSLGDVLHIAPATP